MAILHKTVEWAIRDVREAVDHCDNPNILDVTTILNAFEDLTKDLEEVRFVDYVEDVLSLEEFLARDDIFCVGTVEKIASWKKIKPVMYRKKGKG
jgi:hypothetical protein